ncbi:hypothetical protein GCM10023221_15960 [Luteimicrobium xylanilyticum]|uniref:hypothetical protein n=1 Tax=Luteimicrobium xylanilyticum TaxID=1133546 RepID=UPI0011D277CB|nr:hypothetical protein [Luteimicrobium xylanilyticum]
MSGIEQSIEPAIARLTPSRKAALAAACAEWLIPLLQVFDESSSSTLVGFAKPVLDEVWSALDGGGPVMISASEVESRVPDEDGPWDPFLPYAENALAALVYAIEASALPADRTVIWAVRQVQEAAEYSASRSPDRAAVIIESADRQVSEILGRLAGASQNLVELRGFVAKAGGDFLDAFVLRGS